MKKNRKIHQFEILADRFKSVYQVLSEHTLVRFEEIYAAKIHFVDPHTDISGIEHVRRKIKHNIQNFRQCRFDFDEGFWQRENCILITWDVHITHPLLNWGRSFHFPGVSKLIVENEKIIFHQDIYDVGESLYQWVPFVRWFYLYYRNRVRQ